MFGQPKREPNMDLRKGAMPLIHGSSGVIFWTVEEGSKAAYMLRLECLLLTGRVMDII